MEDNTENNINTEIVTINEEIRSEQSNYAAAIDNQIERSSVSENSKMVQQVKEQSAEPEKQVIISDRMTDEHLDPQLDSHEETPCFGVKTPTIEPHEAENSGLPALALQLQHQADKSQEQNNKLEFLIASKVYEQQKQIQPQVPPSQLRDSSEKMIPEQILEFSQYEEKKAEYVENQPLQSLIEKPVTLKQKQDEDNQVEIIGDNKEKKNQNTKRYFCSNCSHKGRLHIKADFVNLYDFKDRRFLCSQCLTQNDRYLLPLQLQKEHPIQVKTVMKRITINKNHPNAKLISTNLSQLFEADVNRKLLAFIEMQNEYMRKIKKDLAMQFYAVINTFNPHVIDSFIQKLKNQKSTQDKEQIDILGNSMRYSARREFSSMDQLTQSCSVCFKKIGQILDKELEQFSKKFKSLDQSLNLFRIGQVYDDKVGGMKNYLNKNRHLNKMDHLKNRTNSLSRTITIDIQDSPTHQQKNNIYTLTTNRSDPINLIMPTSIMKNPQNPGNHRPSPHKVTFDLTPKQMNPPPQQQISKKSTQQLNTQIYVNRPHKSPDTTIKVTHENYQMIWVHEYKNNQKNIKKAVIHYEDHPERSIQGMFMFQNLEQLNIFDSRLAKNEMVEYYFLELKNLKRLELNCFNNIDNGTVQRITKSSVATNIETFFYGHNYHRNMATIDEKRWFPEQSSIQRYFPLQNSSTQLLLEHMPNLQNIWISVAEPGILNKLKPSIKHISLGSLDLQSLPQQLSEQTWTVISKITGITSLALHKIVIQPSSLEQFFIRNKATLQTLVLHECPKVTDHMLTVLRQNATNLKELMLYRCGQGQFRGDDIWEMRSLETLIIKDCAKADIQRAQMYARQLVNLKHINLMGCPWVTDELIGKLVSASQLSSANFYNTNIASHAANYLKSAHQLKALNLGATRIKGGYIKDLVNDLKLLRKLSLKNLNGQVMSPGNLPKQTIFNKNMFQMGPKMPNLTHIDLSGCHELQNQIFEFLGKFIKFVNITMTNNITKSQRDALIRLGIVVISDRAE